jgi:aspartyl-tRNA(Asn)/glutamyl-tRNA(Gln) amidotransferase subunit A
MGTYSLSAGYYDAYYKRAQAVRSLVAADLEAALGKWDLLLSPAAPTPAYRLGDKTSDPLAMYRGDLTTVNLNLAGLPAVTVPCGLSGGLPVGLQVVGRAWGEGEMLRVAHIFEQTGDHLGGAEPKVRAV